MAGLDFDKVGAFLLKAIGPFFGLVGKLLLVFLFLVFIVAGRGRGTAKLTKALGERGPAAWRRSSVRSTAQIRKYLVIKTAVSLANGLMVWIVLLFFGVDFAALFGLLAFFLNFIPNIGSFFATVLRVGFAFFQFGNFWTPFWILVVTDGLDMILGNIRGTADHWAKGSGSALFWSSSPCSSGAGSGGSPG